MASIMSYSPGIENRKLPIARAMILLSAALTLVFLAAGCGDGLAEGSPGEEASAGEPAAGRPERTSPPSREDDARPGNGAEAREGGAVARAGDGRARAGDVVAGDGDAGEAEARAGSASRTGKVRLRITGTPGAGFSGTCTVGEEKEDIGGEAPERFVYRLDGEELKCNIRLRGPGELEIVLIGGGTRAVQQISSNQSTVDISYASSGVAVVAR